MPTCAQIPCEITDKANVIATCRKCNEAGLEIKCVDLWAQSHSAPMKDVAEGGAGGRHVREGRKIEAPGKDLRIPIHTSHRNIGARRVTRAKPESSRKGTSQRQIKWLRGWATWTFRAHFSRSGITPEGPRLARVLDPPKEQSLDIEFIRREA